jgi:hypothetical protein
MEPNAYHVFGTTRPYRLPTSSSSPFSSNKGAEAYKNGVIGGPFHFWAFSVGQIYPFPLHMSVGNWVLALVRISHSSLTDCWVDPSINVADAFNPPPIASSPNDDFFSGAIDNFLPQENTP